MLTSAPPQRWITNSAAPNVRVQVTPHPSDAAAVAILSALQHTRPEPVAPPHGARASAWHRVALVEAAGDGAAWEPGT